MDLPTGVTHLLEQLELQNVILIEWQNALWNRLGYPLIEGGDLFFLVPDDQLRTVAKTASPLGYKPADRASLPLRYACEHSSRALRYIARDLGGKAKNRSISSSLTRLVFVPLSWTGISGHETMQLWPYEHNLPCTVYTVPIPVVCSALVRIASHKRRGSKLRAAVLAELCDVLTYRYFDMGGDGDNADPPADDQPMSDKEALALNNAVNDLGGWDMREDEEWIRTELIQAVTGAKSYDDLRSKTD
ncbi:hypothetical protein GGR52DRAFT_562628 [Hypoxylon sp. FL1284]|nr:hypothetical protein GGR52DRAFT_562628 [Hypoxylon sp. FL1284]